MGHEYFILAILSFLFILSRIKYSSLEHLKDSLLEYLAECCEKEEIQEEEIFELEEVRDMIIEFIVENKKIFSNINYNNE